MARPGNPLALTTGQAARYCFVTSETILNWIRTGQLAAQRTAGGQYRIRVPDLRQFLVAHNMSTELLEEETGTEPYCWEYHRGLLEGGEGMGALCVGCPVFRAGARACWELHELLPAGRRLIPDCGECEYYQRYGPEHGPRAGVD